MADVAVVAFNCLHGVAA